jgi:hypothetical protein
VLFSLGDVEAGELSILGYLRADSYEVKGGNIIRF